MKIIYLHQYYNTPETGGPLRSYYLSTALARAGHSVELITSHNSSKYLVKEIEGVKVHFLPINYENNYGFFKRIFAFICFVWKSIIIAKRIKADMCFATSTPLTVGIISLFLKAFKGIPYVFEIRDLWPQAPVQLGYIKSKIAILLLEKLEIAIYKNAKEIIGLSKPISDTINQKLKFKTPVHIITNIADVDFYNSKTETNKLLILEKYRLPEAKMIISYFGAAGFANGLHKLVNAAFHVSQNSSDVLFICAAKGSELNKLKLLCEYHQLKNLFFIPYLNKADLKELLSVSDFTYLSYADYPILGTGSPNKFFESLAAGIPVISNNEGWWNRYISEYNCGFSYYEKDNDFYKKLLPFLTSDKLLSEAKSNAKKLAIEKFERKTIEMNFVKILTDTFDKMNIKQ